MVRYAGDRPKKGENCFMRLLIMAEKIFLILLFVLVISLIILYNFL